MSGIVNHQQFKRGQSLTEFALTMSFILVLLAGIVDVGHALFVYITMRDAAQEGAIYGSYSPEDCAGMITRVRDHAPNPIDLSDTSLVDVTALINGAACTSATDPCSGDELEIIVDYNDLEITTPLLGTIVGSQTIDLTTSVKDTIIAPLCP